MKNKRNTKNMPHYRKMERACDYLHKRIKTILPYIYSAIVLAMWEILDETDDEKTQDIQMLLNKSSEIWNECVENGIDVIEKCQEDTGFDIRQEVL